MNRSVSWKFASVWCFFFIVILSWFHIVSLDFTKCCVAFFFLILTAKKFRSSICGENGEEGKREQNKWNKVVCDGRRKLRSSSCDRPKKMWQQHAQESIFICNNLKHRERARSHYTSRACSFRDWIDDEMMMVLTLITRILVWRQQRQRQQ